MSQIDWNEDWDENDNSIWEGLSPFTTDNDPEACPDVYWRLKQELVDNTVRWYQAHDAELGGVDKSTFWLSLDAAKNECQVAHDHILRTELGSG